MSPRLPRVVILASGSGSNAQVLIDRAAQPEAPFQVVAVVSDHADARVLERASAASVRTEVLEKQPGEPRDRYDNRLARILSGYSADIVVLAGWMRILTGGFCAQFPIINLHPALPGAFPGPTAIADALQAFSAGQITETGLMVHWVPDAGVDTGPVIATEIVPILTDDTLDTLANRIHAVEHRLLPAALETALLSLSSAASSTAHSAVPN